MISDPALIPSETHAMPLIFLLIYKINTQKGTKYICTPYPDTIKNIKNTIHRKIIQNLSRN